MRWPLSATVAPAMAASLALLCCLASPPAARAQQLTVNLADAPAEAAAGDPNTLTVRLGGRVLFFLGGYGLSSANTGYAYDDATGYAAAAPFAVAPGGAIVAPTAGTSTRASVPLRQTLPAFRPADIARLYPSLTGVTGGGIKYGLSLDVGIADIGEADGGLYNGPLAVGRVSNQPQLRRAYLHVGRDDDGTVRVGATDGPASLFMTGNFERFNSGGWNGAVPYSLPRQWNTIWPFADVEAEYSTAKIVYLSPQLGDLDAAIGFEPSGNGLLGAEQSGCAAAPLRTAGRATGGVTQAGSGCDLTVATTADAVAVSALAGRRDTFDAAARYRSQFGLVGVAAYVDYTASANVHDGGGVGGRAQSYRGLNVGSAGLQVYYAGFTLGGMVTGGTINNTTASYGLQPAGTAPQTAFLLGGSYAIERITLGAHYFSSWQAGYQTAAAAAAVGTYHAQGAAAGGTYAVMPGVSVYLEYLWGQLRQNGYDLDLFSVGATHNALRLQYVGLGTGVSW